MCQEHYDKVVQDARRVSATARTLGAKSPSSVRDRTLQGLRALFVPLQGTLSRRKSGRCRRIGLSWMSGSVVLFYRPSLSRLGDPHLKNRLFMRMKILRYAADRDNRFGDVRTTVSDLRRGVYIRFVPCLLRRMTSDKTQLLKAYAGQSTEIAYHQDNSYICKAKRTPAHDHIR